MACSDPCILCARVAITPQYDKNSHDGDHPRKSPKR
jgi:hypothetical protein